VGAGEELAAVLVKPEVVVEQPAKADLADAMDWYRRVRPGLETDFRLCVDEALERVRRHPEANLLTVRQLRRALLHRFPYVIFYLNERSLIRVVAVLHTSRDPRVLAVCGH
jgi:plasmid stabilization system protein ParE